LSDFPSRNALRCFYPADNDNPLPRRLSIEWHPSHGRVRGNKCIPSSPSDFRVGRTTRGSAAKGLARFLRPFAKIVTGPESVAAVLLTLSDRSATISCLPLEMVRPERPISCCPGFLSDLLVLIVPPAGPSTPARSPIVRLGLSACPIVRVYCPSLVVRVSRIHLRPWWSASPHVRLIRHPSVFFLSNLGFDDSQGQQRPQLPRR
jgi:hypothetical protein